MCDSQTDMEEQLAIEFCVRCYHNYNNVCSSCQGRATMWIYSQEHEGHAVAML